MSHRVKVDLIADRYIRWQRQVISIYDIQAIELDAVGHIAVITMRTKKQEANDEKG